MHGTAAIVSSLSLALEYHVAFLHGVGLHDMTSSSSSSRRRVSQEQQQLQPSLLAGGNKGQIKIMGNTHISGEWSDDEIETHDDILSSQVKVVKKKTHGTIHAGGNSARRVVLSELDAYM